MALATLLALSACHRAYGGGYLDEPLDGGPVVDYQGRANFGFNFTCPQNERAEIKGQITYHDSPSTIDGQGFPEISLHGTVENVLVEVDHDEVPETEPIVKPASTCEELLEAQAAHFEGTYRPQGKTPGVPGYARDGRFNVLVFDQGEPGRSQGDFTGDGFSIELHGGAYAVYTRGGYIEGGNVQVRGSK